MHRRARIACCALLLASTCEALADTPAPAAAAFKLDGVATWRGDATAAYSIVHDDLCDPRRADILARAVPELSRHGLRAGFGAIAGACTKNDLWAQVKDLVNHGHDVINHSWSHPCMTANPKLAARCDRTFPRSTDYAVEIDKAAAVLAANGIAPGFFAFPFDACDPAAVSRLKEQGYLGARCGARGINAADFADGFSVRFEVWVRASTVHDAAPPCRGPDAEASAAAQASTACRTYALTRHVDDAIERNGWAIRELHGFDGDAGGWGAIALDDYVAHLRYVAAKVTAGELWVDGPTPILKYRFARLHCPAPTVNRNRLEFAVAVSAECVRYATVLSYRVSTADGSDPATLGVVQAGVMLPARNVGRGRFVVDADPTKGDAILSDCPASSSGCAAGGVVPR